ncbi:ParB/Srx family N-terminal domain-containing protein [Pseudorhodoplanes sp.]|uniref:ParB/Srx family N-terminal domain-containing protein n=1 Tax=Pseudorhodoplanes sp. TaxID=1934341 RepID=UPI002C37DFE8|nr:ParB/Srx family N-terminal domain-containing protein [Pseudorhodoplanes sp.]HWV54818.1 ParB/Srx family N-terminal domain-containing protein [Pseudorhodoplanes sp.]
MGTLAIKYKDPRKLKPRAKNPRTHTPRQIKQIAASIQEFGFINPVLVDGSDGIVAGHARVEAATSVGMTDVPTVRVDHLSPAQIRAYVIADNRLAEKAGWWVWPRFRARTGCARGKCGPRCPPDGPVG